MKTSTELDENRGDIPIDKFSAVLDDLMSRRDLTYADLEGLTGMPLGSLQAMIRDGKLEFVSRGWAWIFFRRLQGLPTEPFEHEKKQMERDAASNAEFEFTHGVIECPGSWTARANGCTCTRCKKLMNDYKREWRRRRYTSNRKPKA